MNWLVDRLQEKSTMAALVGLVTSILHYTPLPTDIQNPLAGFLAAILVSFAATKG